MIIKAGNFIFPSDFVDLDIGENWDIPMILRRPFLASSRALLDFETCEMILEVEDKQKTFTMNTLLKQPLYLDECKVIEIGVW